MNNTSFFFLLSKIRNFNIKESKKHNGDRCPFAGHIENCSSKNLGWGHSQSGGKEAEKDLGLVGPERAFQGPLGGSVS